MSGRPETDQAFDPDFYLGAYPDVAAAGINPLEHWMKLGKQEGRIGCRPETDQAFDPDFYLRAYPDVAAAGVNPFDHWMKFGRREGRVGCRPEIDQDFDPDFYLIAYPDVAAAGIDPFDHWMKTGKKEGRLGCHPESDQPFDRDFYIWVENGNKDGDVSCNNEIDIGFDRSFYLKAYPDVADTGINPFEHWIKSGKQEGRLGACLPLHGKMDLDPRKKTILVVSHEASRTGAPILCLNIVKSIADKYNIVSLLLKDGTLTEEFVLMSNIVYSFESIAFNQNLVTSVINTIVRNHKIDRALVNCVVSYGTLPSLAEASIPIVFLIHEFSSLVFPLSIMSDILSLSTEVVFSAPIIFKDAKSRLPDWIPGKRVHILPQGRCDLFAVASMFHDEADKIRQMLRPADWPQDTKVVVGMGSVNFRKGVDLFIQCAHSLLRRKGSNNIRFVWIGGGYDPDHDMAYSVYLQEQVRLSNLDRHMVFMNEVSSIEVAYQEADVFLLTSRLDPLPNVGIDAISVGLPIICFDNASGIADILKEEDMAESCVVPYLDTTAMVAAAARILDHPALHEYIRHQLIDIGMRRFDMCVYTSSLVQLLEAAAYPFTSPI